MRQDMAKDRAVSVCGGMLLDNADCVQERFLPEAMTVGLCVGVHYFYF